MGDGPFYRIIKWMVCSVKLLVALISGLAMKRMYESLFLRKRLVKFLTSFTARVLRPRFLGVLCIFTIYRG
jgi:cytochrome b subunit of formate dehydrogenase